MTEDDEIKVRSPDVESELLSELERVASKEEITEDDLERLRTSLPRDPFLAKAVKRTLPYPWSELFEYVEGSDRQRAYWRTTQDRSAIRSEDDRVNKEKFAEAAKEAQGVRGTVDRDGKLVPASAAKIGDEMSNGEGFVENTVSSGRRALRRLREILDN